MDHHPSMINLPTRTTFNSNCLNDAIRETQHDRRSTCGDSTIVILPAMSRTAELLNFEFLNITSFPLFVTSLTFNFDHLFSGKLQLEFKKNMTTVKELVLYQKKDIFLSNKKLVLNSPKKSSDVNDTLFEKYTFYRFTENETCNSNLRFIAQM